MELLINHHQLLKWGLVFFTSLAFVPSTLVLASELAPKAKLITTEKNFSTPIELSVRGSSAGITTDYYEANVVEAINASGIFDSEIDQDYSLDIRIVKVDTPSFSKNMTVSMKTVWKLYRNQSEALLLEENIHSTYTGNAFEGGVIGANRVRVAMEGAARESIRSGVELIDSLKLNKNGSLE